MSSKHTYALIACHQDPGREVHCLQAPLLSNLESQLPKHPPSYHKVLIKHGIHKCTMQNSDPSGQGGVGLISTTLVAIYSYVHMS